MKIIPKAKNTSEHKYNQRYGQSNAVKAIKAIQSTIRSEPSKQYDQRYNQDNFGGGIGYIIDVKK